MVSLSRRVKFIIKRSYIPILLRTKIDLLQLLYAFIHYITYVMFCHLSPDEWHADRLVFNAVPRHSIVLYPSIDLRKILNQVLKCSQVKLCTMIAPVK